jgi:hypothetical protein
MRKISIFILSAVVLLMLIVAGTLTFLYSSSGNGLVRSYLEKRLTRELGIPVMLSPFELRRGHVYFIARLEGNVSLGFDGQIDPIRRRISGRYRLKATQATLRGYRLRQADIAGTLNGLIDALQLDGKGTLLDGPVALKVRIRKQSIESAVIQLRKIPLAELLVLAGQPPMARGELNADILLPSIRSTYAQGKAIVQLQQAHFDPKVIAREYRYNLPANKTALKGEARIDLSGTKATFQGRILSDLVTARIEHGQANLDDRTLACNIDLETLELAPLSQNSLHGPFKLAGVFKYTALGPQLRATSRSLGGKVAIDYTKTVAIDLKEVSLARVLHLIGEEAYAHGDIEGKLTLDSPKATEGNFALSIPKGIIDTARFNHRFSTALPGKKVPFELRSSGTVRQGTLVAKAHLVSALIRADIAPLKMKIATGALQANYRIHVPDPLRLSGKRSDKPVAVDVAGIVEKANVWRITGSAKGVGKKLTFDYTDNRLKLEAQQVQIGRALAGAGLPAYVSGAVDAHVDLQSLDPIEGVMRLHAPALKTNPEAMASLIGKRLDTQLNVQAKGRAQKGLLQADVSLSSPLADVHLLDVRYHSDRNRLESRFTLKTPELAKLEPLIGTRLRGPMTTQGRLRWADGAVDIQGTTASLGGRLGYAYKGKTVRLNASEVPLSRLLHLLDQPERFEGLVRAKVRYDTAARNGVVQATARDFRFKPGTFATAVKVVLHKDLAQIIYDKARLDATIRNGVAAYTFKAHGKRSDFAIRDGRYSLDERTNKASFGLRIDTVDVVGTVRGKIDDPKVRVLPGKMLRAKLKKKAANVIKSKVGGSAGNAAKGLIEKLPF